VPRGADVYILSHVLHDWSDAEALKILRNCREAIAPGGRLLIVEMVRGETARTRRRSSMISYFL
jgi:SAM-dependent methyltransferase